MANDKKFIVKNGLRADNIEFTDSQSGSNQITLSMLNSDTLNFEGDAGSLFSIADDLTGSVFTVGDVSGIPIIDVNGDTHNVTMAQFDGKVMIGGTDSGSTDSDVLNVTGNVKATKFIGNVTGNLTGSANGDHVGSLDGNATTATTATNVAVADESTDTTCFPLFTTAASGNLPPKSGSNLTFNSSSGLLTATTFSGSAANLSQIPMAEASGTLAAARVGELPASKITSGTFDSARIPILAIGAGNVTSGSFADARIPNLAASKITSGVFDSARIPVTGDITAEKITSGIIDSARLPAGTFGGGGGGTADAIAADNIQVGDAAINLTTNTGNITIDAQGNDTDIIFKGTDGGVDRTFLTIDGSEAGKATFLSEIVTTGLQASGDTFIDSAGGFLFDVSDKALEFGDNYRAKFGAGSDLQIYHNGTHSYIQDGGTGDLVILTNQIAIRNAAQNADIIRGIQGGAVTLSHDGSAKLATASDGVQIQSTNNNGPTLSLISDDPSDAADFHTEGHIKFFAENDASQSVEYANIEMVTRDVSDGSEDGRIEININEAGTVTRSFIFDHDRFYITNAQQIHWLDWSSTNDYILRPTTTLSGERTVTLPDASGEVLLTDGSGASLTNLPAGQLTGTIDSARLPDLATSDITSGVLDSARVPIKAIGAGNITSGTIASARLSLGADDIPNLSGAKITSGTVAAARIDNLAASKINSGTFDSARIPVMSIGAGNITSGTIASARLSLAASDIPNLAASKINAGVLDSARIPNAFTETLEFNPGTAVYDPSSGSQDTATDVAISLASGARIVGHSSGYIRTLLEWNSSSALEIGRNNTSLIAHTKIYGGNNGVELYEGSTKRIETTTSGAAVTGTLTATTFSGSGASLTTLNASNISSGTVDSARLPAGITFGGGGGSGTGIDETNGIFLEYQKRVVSDYNVDAGVTALTACNDSDGIEIISGVTVTISDSSGWVITNGDKNMGLDAMIATSNQTERTMRTGTIKPTLNNTYDLGDSAVAWRNIYTNDLNLSNETGSGNDVDGTTGKWTIQEGEENLYIINRKTGKKYKFMLEEIV